MAITKPPDQSSESGRAWAVKTPPGRDDIVGAWLLWLPSADPSYYLLRVDDHLSLGIHAPDVISLNVSHLIFIAPLSARHEDQLDPDDTSTLNPAYESCISLEVSVSSHEAALRIAQAMVNACLKRSLVPGLGHLLAWEQFAETAQLETRV
jgi:hypothetical protein